MLLRADDLAKSFADRVLFRNVGLHVGAGDRVGLIGPNGAGKTTLLRILVGDEHADEGRVATPRSVRVALLRQEIDPTRSHPVREEVTTAFEALDALERLLAELEAEMARRGREGREVGEELAERYDAARAAFAFGGGFEREARVDAVLEGLGFDAAARARPLSSFSGGWLMRVELAKLLLSSPDVLLLDEPTNHLDLPSIQWFEETLAAYRGGVVMISHDRTFLRRHAGRIAELEGGELSVFDGNYDRYLEQKALRRAHLEARRRSQDRRRAETERFIERFRYKASKARQVQSRVKALERQERIEVPEERRPRLRLRIPPPARAGDVVLRLDGIQKRYGDTVVYRGVDLLVRRGDRVALVGPNGAGKSTLLRIAAGVLDWDGGERRPGHGVEVAFFAQHQLESLDPRRSVLEELASVATTDDHPRLRGHLGAFLFSGDDVDKKVTVLSGGEKARLALAKLLLRPSNFLVLDEPTNHLDVLACEVLEEVLRSYEGTLLFISHDRTFIDALANRVVEVRAGALREFPGNYADYLVRTAGAEVATSEGTTPAEAKRRRMEARERARERTRRRQRDKKRLAALEAEIAALEERVVALGERLGEPDVYRDGEAVRVLESERDGVRAAIAALYREWEAVEAALAGPEADGGS